MTEKELIRQIKRDASLRADVRLWDEIGPRLLALRQPQAKRSRVRISILIPAFTCCIVLAAGWLIYARFLSRNQSAVLPDTAGIKSACPSSDVPGSVVNGECLFEYYRYNGSYYRLDGASAEIQDDIEKCLYNSFYAIRDVDPAERIALYANREYWELTYVFSDTVDYNGKPYLLNMNETVESAGSLLGTEGKRSLYCAENADSSAEIAVQYDGGCSPAYQMPSSVRLNGITYEVEPSFYDGAVAGAQNYLGKADGYDAYQIDGTEAAQAIAIQLDGGRLARAQAIETPSDGQTVAQSIQGSVWEHFSAQGEIQYKGHGIYAILAGYDTEAAQRDYKQRAEDLLDTETVGGTVYDFYRLQGTDPADTIVARYNGVYVPYSFVFPDAIVYDGSAYSADFTKTDDSINGIRIIKGERLDDAHGYSVYAIRQIDPSIAVIAEVSGSHIGTGVVSMELTFYRGQPSSK